MWRCSLYLVLLSAVSLISQTAQTPAPADLTFKTKAQLVLVDVVVTDNKGHPLTGLQKHDFEIFESADLMGRGARQTIASFEEHKSAPPKIDPLRPSPNFYNNAPTVASADSVSVLLLDILNTLPEDQAEVRRQVIEYLRTNDPGPRLAIFALDPRLRIVHGFTSDSQSLIGALGSKNSGAMPQASTPVQSDAEAAANQELSQQMADTHASSGGIQALQDFLSEQKATEQGSRVSGSLEAIRLLCRYLSGFPGRKNLIWFSGSFPNILITSLGQRTPNLALERELSIGASCSLSSRGSRRGNGRTFPGRPTGAAKYGAAREENDRRHKHEPPAGLHGACREQCGPR